MRVNLILRSLCLLLSLSVQGLCDGQPFVTWNHPAPQTNLLTTHHTYHSKVMNTPVGYNIYLPPGYQDPANTNRFPVIYWLHGKGGSENSDSGRAARLESAVRAGKLPPLIQVWVCGGGETFYADSFDGRWMAETTIINELIPHIDATWRTLPMKQQRAIQGMSMGGFGAMRLALKHPELFSSVVAFAGGYRDPKLMMEEKVKLNFQIMFNNDAGFWMEGHPFTTAKANAGRIRGKLAVKMLCGEKDYLLEPNRRMHAILTEAGLEHEYDEVPEADHNMDKYEAWIGLGHYEFAVDHFEKAKP